jgi:hypothetical protein
MLANEMLSFLLSTQDLSLLIALGKILISENLRNFSLNIKRLEISGFLDFIHRPVFEGTLRNVVFLQTPDDG